MSGRARLLYCYDPADAALREALDKHLSLLRSAGLLQTWHPQLITPGAEIEAELSAQLAQADLVLLLVSADALASAACQALIRRVRQRRIPLVPVLGRDVDWEASELAGLQVLPSTGVPVTLWPNQDAAWANVARGLRQLLEAGSAERPASERDGMPWTIPAPSPYFTGRDDEVAALRTALATERRAAVSQVQAVSGLGGIGKTQLALTYADKHHGEYEAGFLLRADSELSLHTSLLEMREHLGLRAPESNEPKRLLQAVVEWMNSHAGWLLVFDNADDLQLVRPFVSIGHMGHILVTTRAMDCTPLGIAEPLALKKLTPSEAMDFLKRRTGYADPGESELQALQDLARELDHLPLALEQAGAYMAARKARVGSYLASFLRRRTDLLAHKPVMGGYGASVMTTWSLNMDEIRTTSAPSAALMDALAFLGPDAIPEELLVHGAAELGGDLAKALSDAETDPLALDDLLEPLCRYSLVERDRETAVLSVHRLVQAVVKDRLTKDAHRQWAERIVSAMAKVFPVADYQTWKRCERLIAHAKVGSELIEKWELDVLRAGNLLELAASYLHDHAQYREAAPLYIRALSIKEKALGPDHPDVANSCNNLAVLYLAQGKYAEAEPLFLRDLAIAEKALGPDHPDVATTCNNLAELYRTQGKYAEAEPLFLRALAIREKALGPDHPDVAQSCNNLALLYKAQGKYAEAEPLSLRALAIREKALGPDHPDVANTCNNLAGLYQDQGKYAEAEPLSLRALAISEKALGPDHPDVARSCNNLAGLYKAQGKYPEAEPLFLRALAISEKALGPDHPYLAITRNSLASLYKAQGRHDEAAQFAARAKVRPPDKTSS